MTDLLPPGESNPRSETENIELPIAFTVLRPITFPSTGGEQHLGISRQTISIPTQNNFPNYEVIDKETKVRLVPSRAQFFFDPTENRIEQVNPEDNCQLGQPAVYIANLRPNFQRLAGSFLVFHTGTNEVKRRLPFIGKKWSGKLDLIDLMSFYPAIITEFDEGSDHLTSCRFSDQDSLQTAENYVKRLTGERSLSQSTVLSDKLSEILGELYSDSEHINQEAFV